jgi:putative salt-induced outer membrane protein YdiY
MIAKSTRFALLLLCLTAHPLFAQALPAAPPPPPPIWDVQVGASFVGTNGNSDTSSTGADFSLHRRWPVWQIESTATAVRTSASDVETAERYLAGFRGQRALTKVVKLSAGERAEHDPRAGIDFRNILDAGLSWALMRQTTWTLDAVTALAWNHERPTIGVNRDDPAGVFQLLSRIPFSANGDTTQRFTFYPDFRDSAAYRSEAEITVQAAMTSRLALKAGYMLRYSNAPVPGFKKTDNTTTASIVLRWKAAETIAP